MSPFLVLGVGNTLMSDDGVGVRLLERLQSTAPPMAEVDYVDAGTLSFILLPRIQACGGLIVLDAAHLGETPGAMRTLTGPDMDEFLRTARCSVHEVGMRDLLDLARLTDSLPERRAFVGIQPKEVGWGDVLSPEVAAAVPGAVARVLALLTDWTAAAGRDRKPREVHDHG